MTRDGPTLVTAALETIRTMAVECIHEGDSLSEVIHLGIRDYVMQPPV